MPSHQGAGAAVMHGPAQACGWKARGRDAMIAGAGPWPFQEMAMRRGKREFAATGQQGRQRAAAAAFACIMNACFADASLQGESDG